MVKDLIIIGASGFAKEVKWLVERINAAGPTWNVIGFMDNNISKIGTNLEGVPILDEALYRSNYSNAFYVCAIASSEIRKKVVNKFKEAKFATLVDPSVIISDCVNIGEGSIICAGSIVTVDVTIGKHVIINLDCTVGHDSLIQDFVTLYPSVNLSGLSIIGNGSEIGTGTKIIQMKKVGMNTIIGAGATVVTDIPNNCTAVGVPAKPIKFSPQEVK